MCLHFTQGRITKSKHSTTSMLDGGVVSRKMKRWRRRSNLIKGQHGEWSKIKGTNSFNSYLADLSSSLLRVHLSILSKLSQVLRNRFGHSWRRCTGTDPLFYLTFFFCRVFLGIQCLMLSSRSFLKLKMIRWGKRKIDLSVWIRKEQQQQQLKKKNKKIPTGSA